jgi:hypothetical protein
LYRDAIRARAAQAVDQFPDLPSFRRRSIGVERTCRKSTPSRVESATTRSFQRASSGSRANVFVRGIGDRPKAVRTLSVDFKPPRAPKRPGIAPAPTGSHSHQSSSRACEQCTCNTSRVLSDPI